jgi:hypothetical protein
VCGVTDMKAGDLSEITKHSFGRCECFMLLIWVVTPCGLVGRINVSEEHTRSIIREDVPL